MSDPNELEIAAWTYLSVALTWAAITFRPRMGLFRALLLARKSKMRPDWMPPTSRIDQMNEIKQFIRSHSRFGKKYLLVTGLQGVGKTCLIHTAAEQLGGTVCIHVDKTEASQKIIKKSISALSGTDSRFIDPAKPAARVCRVYRLMFGRPLSLMITTYSGFTKEMEYAVRRLTRDYDVRVLFDVNSKAIELDTFYPSELKVPNSLRLNKFNGVDHSCEADGSRNDLAIAAAAKALCHHQGVGSR